MKSKVILFCVGLFCSQIVESVPYSKDHVRQRAHQPSNWQENGNIPKQFPNTGVPQTQHGIENNQGYFANQEGHKYDSNGNNNNPTPSMPEPAKEMLIDSYPLRRENYSPGINDDSQIKLHNQQYRKQNWQSQNQYGSNGGTAHESPLVTRESFRGPDQYPSYSAPKIQQYYQTDRKQYPHQLAANLDNDKYVVNPAPHLGSSSPISYGSYREASDAIERISGGNSYGDSSRSQGPANFAPSEIYNRAAFTDTAAHKFEKIRQVKNYESNSRQINPVPLNNYNDGSIIHNRANNFVNSRYVHNFGSHGSSNTAPVHRSNDGASIISGNLADNNGNNKYVDYGSGSGISEFIFANTADIADALSEKLGKNEYVDSYKSDSGSSNFALLNKYNDSPEAVITNNSADNTGNSKHVDNYRSDFGATDMKPAEIIEDLSENDGKNKYEDTNGSDSRSSNTPAMITGYLAKKSGNGRYPENYGSDFRSSKVAPGHANHNAPKIITHDATITDTSGKHFGTNKFVNNNGYDYGSSNPFLVDTNNGGPDAPTVIGNFENTKYADNSGPPRHRSSNAEYFDHLSPEMFHQSRTGNIDMEKIASHPIISELLLTNKKGYLIINSDGSVKYMDESYPSTQSNPNYSKDNHHVGPKHAVGDGAYTAQLPVHESSNTGTKSAPMDEQTVNPSENNNDTQESLDSSKYDYSSSKGLPSIDFDDDTSPTLLIPNKPNYIQSPLVSNEKYNSSSTTLPLIVSDYNKSPTQLPNTTDYNQTPRPASSDSSTVATTPPSTGNSFKDGIITISPIESATNNVSDVPPVTSTTANPVKRPNTSDTDYNKQDEEPDNSVSTDTTILEKDQKYTTTTVAPSTSVSPIDNNSSHEIITDDNSSNYNTVTDQTNNPKNESQIAIFNSLSNTDVPAKYDDYSPTTTGSSVPSDVNTGDTSSTPGDNPLESNQSTNDLIITITANDSEDGSITITIEVSESTDDADSSSDEKTIEVSIDTHDGSDDDPKPPSKADGNCKKDQSTNNTNKGKNLEIDVLNFKGEPTVWVKTTDEDLIDKLTAKDDSSVVYFFSLEPQVRVETEKHTTIHCNGTVFIEVTKSTWKNKDDPFPKIVKTTKVINPE